MTPCADSTSGPAGGTVISRGTPCRVNDYASSTSITHDYDTVVIGEEQLTSIFAFPITAHGTMRGVLYGAVRDRHPIGDVALRNAGVIASHLRRDLEGWHAPPSPARPPGPARLEPSRSQEALRDLAAIVDSVADPLLRERLIRIHHDLGGVRRAAAPSGEAVLAPREIDALRLVAVGASNSEIADRLGLSPQTVKAYLRNAMRKLDVRNRTAAVHAARLAGAL